MAAEEESRSSYIAAQKNKLLHGYAVKRIDSTDEIFQSSMFKTFLVYFF